jgi:hypothetical protein
MQIDDVRALRLRNAGLLRRKSQPPEAFVGWMGAVQSQDHGPAKWALSQRCTGLDESALETAYQGGAILRTHVLRPTWHYVTPRDIVWIVGATGPRILTGIGTALRGLRLDDEVLARCRKLTVRALRREHLTRKELAAVLERGGVVTDSRRMSYIAMCLELTADICSGVPRGKQHTYALVEERAPHAVDLSGDDAVAELTRRYFAGHGPATVKDFAWWSSLTVADVRRGLEMVDGELDSADVDGLTYHFAPTRARPAIRSPMVRLLQAYDEYLVAYRDSKFIADAEGVWAARDGTSFLACVVLDGRIVGRWKPTVTRDRVVVEVDLTRRLGRTAWQELEREASRYGRFIGLPASVRRRGDR